MTREAKPYYLESLEDRYPRWAVRSVYTGVNSFISIFLMAIIAYNTHAPFVFPSLGPTAFLLFYTPLAAASAPHNTLVGHLIGLLAGWFSLAVTGLLAVPPDLEKIDWQRILACAIALGLTCGLMPIFQAAHPPAGATTLIVSLGLIRTPEHLLIMMVAVFVIVLQGFVINRAAGLPYPMWRKRAQNAPPDD
ncbi:MULTISPECIES: HPP family protein [Nonomuraea]|uniref:HPP family protein n=1 Tax=Nonomuraea ferruginea TaxID=46174 RepID=A0ABT4T2E6_9ACTN|nr:MULTISPECIES: HPP family protein [Nonomuraea]MDA0643589.1 HPP family protein [Nonomuraea ferruginea]TXK34447.1 HPP family protein [Nonomuraea sp. C10]